MCVNRPDPVIAILVRNCTAWEALETWPGGLPPTCVACTPSAAAETADPELEPAPEEEGLLLPLSGRAPRMAASSLQAFSCVNQSERCSSLQSRWILIRAGRKGGARSACGMCTQCCQISCSAQLTRCT